MMKCLCILLLVALANVDAAIVSAGEGNLVQDSDATTITNPTTDDDDIVREICQEMGGEGAFEKLQAAEPELDACAGQLGDLDEMEKELNAAEASGNLSAVAHKYCSRGPALKACYNNFTEAVLPCMVPIVASAQRMIQQVLYFVIDYVCHNDGERLVAFANSEGDECIDSKETELGMCATTAFGEGDLSDKVLSAFFNHEQGCGVIRTMQSCWATHLGTCSGQVVDVVNDFIDSALNSISCPARVVPVRTRK